MTRRVRRTVFVLLGALYLVGVGALLGVASERFRFDEVRNSVVRQMEDVTARVRSRTMELERGVSAVQVPSASPATDSREERPVTWSTHLEAMDRALAQRDIQAAAAAWREAHGAAIRTRAWRPLVEVGEAAVRIGMVTGHQRSYTMRAREVYMAALSRARADRSVEGVLHVGEAFEALGDQAIVEQCLIIAERMGASRYADDNARLRALAGRVTVPDGAPRVEP
jgi:hypothetical protein